MLYLEHILLENLNYSIWLSLKYNLMKVKIRVKIDTT